MMVNGPSVLRSQEYRCDLTIWNVVALPHAVNQTLYFMKCAKSREGGADER